MASLTSPRILSSPRDDAMQLYKAFKGKKQFVYSGLVCDTAEVVNILAHRDATQRALIEEEYKLMYHEDLTKRLSSELTGNLKKAVLLWMHDPAQRDAIILHDTLTSDIDLKAATEVICSRTPSQIHDLKPLYYNLGDGFIEISLIEKPDQFKVSGDLEKLLYGYLSIPRSEGMEVDRTIVDYDVESLYEAGEKRFFTDKNPFRIIFTGRSRAHMVAVSSAYQNMYASSLMKAVKSKTSGNFKHALVTILESAENPEKYFAKVMHRAMKGLRTNDKTLIRVIVTRTEIDMQYIKAEYQKKHRKSLNNAVHSKTSGHYRTFLLSLLGPDCENL